MPEPLPKNYSLSASIGYQNLVDKRNNKQAEELNEHLESNVPDIFKNIGAKNIRRKKQPAMSRDKLLESRQTPGTLVITIGDDEETSWALEVVKPLNARDELAVELIPHVMNKVIKYLQDAGFSSDLQDVNKKRKGLTPQTPRGIFSRKDPHGSSFFLAKDHNNKLKTCKTLDDAVTIMQCVHNHEDAEEESEAGDEE